MENTEVLFLHLQEQLSYNIEEKKKMRGKNFKSWLNIFFTNNKYIRNKNITW